MAYYLRIGDDALDEAVKCVDFADAIDKFAEVAEELYQYGQQIEGTVHIATRLACAVEYPDFILSLRRLGGVKVERC